MTPVSDGLLLTFPPEGLTSAPGEDASVFRGHLTKVLELSCFCHHSSWRSTRSTFCCFPGTSSPMKLFLTAPFMSIFLSLSFILSVLSHSPPPPLPPPLPAGWFLLGQPGSAPGFLLLKGVVPVPVQTRGSGLGAVVPSPPDQQVLRSVGSTVGFTWNSLPSNHSKTKLN